MTKEDLEELVATIGEILILYSDDKLRHKFADIYYDLQRRIQEQQTS